MKTLLTPILLDFLIVEGYEYCLSTSTDTNNQTANVPVILTPVKSRPFLSLVSEKFDNYLNTQIDLKRIAEGIDDALVMVEIDKGDLSRYIDFFMMKLSMPKSLLQLNTITNVEQLGN